VQLSTPFTVWHTANGGQFGQRGHTTLGHAGQIGQWGHFGQHLFGGVTVLRAVGGSDNLVTGHRGCSWTEGPTVAIGDLP